MRIFDLWSKSELNLLAKPYNMCMQRIRLTDIFYKRCGYRYDNRKNIHGHQSLRLPSAVAIATQAAGCPVHGHLSERERVAERTPNRALRENLTPIF